MESPTPNLPSSLVPLMEGREEQAEENQGRKYIHIVLRSFTKQINGKGKLF